MKAEPKVPDFDTFVHPLLTSHPKVWQEIRSAGRICHFHKHDVVLRHGDGAHSLWLVIQGWVKITRQTPDGKESVTGLCTYGDVLGEAALFAHANYPYDAYAMDDSAYLLAVPADVIRALIASHKDFSASIMELLNERMSQTQIKLEQMSTMTAAQRLGCFLLRQCKGQMHGETTIHIPLEKHILATYLGMKPETFSRSLQQLRPASVQAAGADMHVKNIDQLREFVCNSCSISGSGMCEIEDES